jgi:hypothetical protein
MPGVIVCISQNNWQRGKAMIDTKNDEPKTTKTAENPEITSANR